MSLRKKLEERICRKEAEIQELEMQIREGRSYVLALQEALKILPKESAGGGTEGDEDVLRSGTSVAAARRALQKSGRPMHLLDILTAIGKQANSANRASLGGSLSAYVRKGEIFTRPAPNTFGLVEFATARADIPSGFGRRIEPGKDDDDEIPF
ncbi:MAG TPA: hypothetical protein VFC47_12920 [Caulobacteraceae bacterium]|nr:hypothetical protein [Caulobacteraceae bacterium]